MNSDEKLRVLGMVCAGLDGRDPRGYILDMDGIDCVQAHNVLKEIDDLLKARWRLMGSPDNEDMIIL